MADMVAPPQRYRRDVLRAAGAGLAAAMGVPCGAQRIRANTFVLVHPAWHGAWVWKKVVPLLERRGHQVITPTLAGLGERSHLASPEIGLETHVNDVVTVLKHENLRDAVLVGHSSSGAVITGAADRAPEHLGQVVYLDAFVPEDGQAVLDLIAPERRQMFETLVKTEGKGWLVPRFAPPPWETIVRDMWGVTDPDDARWLIDGLRPTPFGHFRDPVRRTNKAAEGLPRSYIRCTRFTSPRFDQHAGMAQRTAGWRYRELAGPHHVAVTMPGAVADLLMKLAA